MYDENKVLEESLERHNLTLRFSEMTLKQVRHALQSGNVSSTPLREISLNFFSMVSRYAYLLYKLAPEFPVIPFDFNSHLYSLTYVDGVTMLNCHRCDIEPMEINKVEKAWNSVFDGIKKYQGKEFYALFREGGASIVNHYNEDVHQLGEMEDEIDEFFSPNVKNENVNKNFALMWELMAPRRINRELAFKIKTYVLSTFSFLEYLANCILPFWNEMKLPEWDKFIDICGYKNDKVKTWMDLYDPEKTKVKTTSSQNKKEERPEDINIVDVFFSSLPETEKKIVDEYRKLKKSYRNVLAHGELGKLNLHGLSPIHRDLDTYNGNVYYEGFFVEDMDRHAYLRVRRFSDDFLDMIKRLYPTIMLFLESDEDIPGRPVEYVSLCGSDAQKAEAYLKEMELRDIFDYYTWIAERFPQTDDHGRERLIAECAERFSEFDSIFNKDDSLPEVFHKLILVENKLLIQFDRYVVLDEATGLAHYGKRKELEEKGISWNDFVSVSQNSVSVIPFS